LSDKRGEEHENLVSGNLVEREEEGIDGREVGEGLLYGMERKVHVKA
jgi:hypothetical protein